MVLSLEYQIIDFTCFLITELTWAKDSLGISKQPELTKKKEFLKNKWISCSIQGFSSEQEGFQKWQKAKHWGIGTEKSAATNSHPHLKPEVLRSSWEESWLRLFSEQAHTSRSPSHGSFDLKRLPHRLMMTIKSTRWTGRDDTGGLFLPVPASATFQVPGEPRVVFLLLWEIILCRIFDHTPEQVPNGK